jgi:3'-phosphoadenosine 5'-phosphosulfate sulfotransferase (PAPS reductase)/FAD synthetase
MHKPSALRVQRVTLTAAKIRRLRDKLRWTQARFAVVVGVHRSTVSRWERGCRRPCDASARRLETLALTSKRAHAVRASSPAKKRVATVRESDRREVLARLNGRRVVASVSGGKDSAAMSLYLHELGIDHDRVFLDTSWESPITYEYLRGELQRALGPITWIKGQRTMEELIRHKGMFPGRRIRFCTQMLKVYPMANYLRERMNAGEDVVNAVGIRAAESVARSQLPEWEFQDTFDCEVWRPLIRWTEQQVIEIHHRHGLRPNPLYLLGATRVGCWPCIFARKSEIRLVADTDPARIVRLRVLEDEIGVAARARAARDGGELPNAPAWFQNPVSRPGPDGHRDGSCWPIDRVVEWSRSAGRGPLMSQDEFLFAAQLDGCMRWGLCDTGAANTLPAEVSHAG